MEKKLQEFKSAMRELRRRWFSRGMPRYLFKEVEDEAEKRFFNNLKARKIAQEIINTLRAHCGLENWWAALHPRIQKIIINKIEGLIAKEFTKEEFFEPVEEEVHSSSSRKPLRVRREGNLYLLEREEHIGWKRINWFYPPGSFWCMDNLDEFRELLKPFGFEHFGYAKGP